MILRSCALAGTSEIGLLRANLPVGRYVLTLCPTKEEPYQNLRVPLEIEETGASDRSLRNLQQQRAIEAGGKFRCSEEL